MSGDLRNRFVSKAFFILFLGTVATLSVSQNLFADINHYKNFLVGDRASLMGGAYAGVSDDAAGAYYNPAGISFAFGDSVSGSGNAYHKVNTKYSKVLGKKYDWQRDSTALLPNYFGLIKKYGNSSFALSYVVPETMIEHQDQVYTDINTVSKYLISLHSEDHIYLFGPSYAYKFSDSFSMGATLYYYYREYRLQQGQYLQYVNSQEKVSYFSEKQIENGLSARVGLQLNLSDSIVIGLTGSQTALTLSDYVSDFARIDETGLESDLQVSSRSSTKRKLPTQLTIGTAFYPSPFWLFTADMDYFIANDSNLENVMNISLGGEWFLDNKSALRFGLFTNNDNRKEPSASTVNQEHIDMTGLSLGYAVFSRSSSVTIGGIYSSGSGKSQPLSGSSTIKDLERTSLTMVFAATYNY